MNHDDSDRDPSPRIPMEFFLEQRGPGGIEAEELYQRAARAGRHDAMHRVKRRFRYETMVRNAKAAGDGYPPYEEWREPGDDPEWQ